MDWIKKNPATAALIAVSVLAFAAAAILYTRVSSFAANFEPKPLPPGAADKSKTPEIEGQLASARAALGKPAAWQPANDSGILLNSRLYVLKEGKLVTLDDNARFHPPVTNAWIRKFGLDLLSSSVLESDPDNDGFTTIQEWEGADTRSHLDMNGQAILGADGQPLPDDSTNPTDPKSHPPYHTRLRVVGFQNKPFPLRFDGYDVNPKDPTDITVQINPVEGKGRTQFIRIGENIRGTDFKAGSLERKEIEGKDGTKIDASELTLVNNRTGDKVLLPLRKPIISPDTLIRFKYLWVPAGGNPMPDFEKRKGDTFSLPPDSDKTYKIVDIKGGAVVVELPGGELKAFQPSK